MSIYNFHAIDFSGNKLPRQFSGKTGDILGRAFSGHLIGSNNLDIISHKFLSEFRGFLSNRINNKHDWIFGLCHSCLIDNFERAFKKIHIKCATQSLVRAEQNNRPPLYGTNLGKRRTIFSISRNKVIDGVLNLIPERPYTTQSRLGLMHLGR